MKLHQSLALVVAAILLPTNFVVSSPFNNMDESRNELEELDSLGLIQDLGSSGDNPDYEPAADDGPGDDEVFVNSLLPKETLDTLGFFEGDIRLTPDQRKAIMEEKAANKAELTGVTHVEKRAVLTQSTYLWPNGRIPYSISGRLNSRAVAAIQSAVNQYTRDTCIRFVPRTAERDYVLFIRDSGCYSYIGRTGGRQEISVGRGCEGKGIVMHEMFHALGRFHEQSRPDRDLYIRINSQNIQRGAEINFDKLSSFEATTNNIGYDFRSLMHYGAYSFSRNRQPTIVPRDSRIDKKSLGQRSGFTSMDLDHINALYCRNEPIAGTWTAWSGWSSCSATCQGGTRSRSRTCQGIGCVGRATETQACNNNVQCYQWGSWGAWNSCSSTCNSGFQARSRTCVRGLRCQGNSFESRTCKVADCPGSWSNWKSWNECSASCGSGKQVRTRYCSGGICFGSDRETRVCVKAPFCSQGPDWGQWSRWSSCSAECGFNGRQSRTRTCQGSTCEGFLKEVRNCNIGSCPGQLSTGYGLGSWGQWRPCSRSCGTGFRTRIRSCTYNNRWGCSGQTFQIQGCNYDSCSPPTPPIVRTRSPLTVTGYEHRSCLEVKIAANSKLHTLNENNPFISDIVEKCIQLAASKGFQTVAITGGYCNSVPDDERSYIGTPKPDKCQNGIGSLSPISLLAYVDIYHINTGS